MCHFRILLTVEVVPPQQSQRCSVRRELVLCMAGSLSSVWDFGGHSLAAAGRCPKCSVSLTFTFSVLPKWVIVADLEASVLSSVIRVL